MSVFEDLSKNNSDKYQYIFQIFFEIIKNSQDIKGNLNFKTSDQ